MLTALPRLVEAYLRQHRTGSQEDFWAFDEVNERVAYSNDGTDAWDVTNALIAAADERSLGYVGAGPLEDFVRRFGASHIESIEGAARKDPKFRSCLGCIWLAEGDLPAPILQRVVAASGGRIRPLPGSQHDA